MNLLKTKFRRGIFRTFQRWYAQNKQRLPRALSLAHRTEQQLVLVADGIPENIMSIHLTRRLGVESSLDASIAFWQDGECIDLKGWFDAKPRKVCGGYICSWCQDHGSAIHYQDLESLWQGEVFEPLLKWMNNHLYSQVRIECKRSPSGGSTWVVISNPSISN